MVKCGNQKESNMKRKNCIIDPVSHSLKKPWENRYVQSVADDCCYFTPKQILACETMDDFKQLKFLARQMQEVQDYADEIAR